jgi:GTP-binding protein HflX
MLIALNKVDRLPDPQQADLFAVAGDNALPISALTGQGLPALLERVEEVLERQMRRVRLHVPHREAGLVALFHEHGLVEAEEHDAEGTWLTGSIPEQFAPAFAPYEVGWASKPPRGGKHHDA